MLMDQGGLREKEHSVSSPSSACIRSLRVYPDVDQGCLRSLALSGLACAAERGTDGDLDVPRSDARSVFLGEELYFPVLVSPSGNWRGQEE